MDQKVSSHWNELQNPTDARISPLISNKNWECPQAMIYPVVEADNQLPELPEATAREWWLGTTYLLQFKHAKHICRAMDNCAIFQLFSIIFHRAVHFKAVFWGPVKGHICKLSADGHPIFSAFLVILSLALQPYLWPKHLASQISTSM